MARDRLWLTEHVALVGSGNLGGFGISHPFDCHVYLVKCEGSAALIDAGCGEDGAAIVRNIETAGVDPAEVRTLFLTHAHYDHAGGAAQLRRLLGLAVVAGPATAALLEAGDEVGIGLVAARAAGLYTPEARFEPCPVERIVRDGERVAIGAIELQAVATAGHSADHLSWWLETPGAVLFGGDSVFPGGRVIVQALPDCNLLEYAATIRRLADLPVRSLLPGHGIIAIDGGAAHIGHAAARLDALETPPNVVW